MQVTQELQKILTYIHINSQEIYVSAMDKFQCFILFKMSCKDMIMIVLQNMCAEIICL